MSRGWVRPAAFGVAVVLVAFVAYEVVIGWASEASVADLVVAHLVVAGLAAVGAGVAAASASRLGGPSGALVGVLAGGAAGTAAACLLAFVSGNGPDEGDGFFWSMVAAAAVSLLAALSAISSHLWRSRDQ